MSTHEDPPRDFWQAIASVPQLVAAGDTQKAADALAAAARLANGRAPDTSAKRAQLIEQLAATYRLSSWRDAESRPAPSRQLPGGVSLVTCCRNRNENLIRALPSWLALPEISEIVIVDWTSSRPVRHDLAAAGFDAPHIRILRVEDEPRWVLSLAFNLGFRHARFERILKADADIVLASDFFEKNTLKENTFVAGNWRLTTQDQAYVNGFFYVWRKHILEIAGFNEYITTYGWDDEEIYTRLTELNLGRANVAQDTVTHLPHDQLARTDRPAPPAQAPAIDSLPAQTMFLTRRNRQIANLMPTWSPKRPSADYQSKPNADGTAVLRRKPATGDRVPPAIEREAFMAAARELLAWRHGDVAYGLDHERTERLLQARSWEGITTADIIGCLAASPEDIRAGFKWLFVDGRGVGTPDAAAAWARLAEVAQRLKFTPIWLGSAPAGYTGAVADPRLPNPPASAVTLRTLEADRDLDGAAFLVRIEASGEHPSAAPAAAPRRAKVFADGRHGLGNRLRAIASAAAIARATDRELVIVWEPDDHCNCHFSDLFDYKGDVITQTLRTLKPNADMTVFNYMEIEDGGAKDVEISLEAGRDVYLRSAYVLRHPASTWDAENAFLRSLTPSRAVLDLVEAVRSPNDISVHIRMAGGREFEHLPWEAPDNWTDEGHKLVAHWREQSHYSRFIKRLDEVIVHGDARTIFLAADLPETYDALSARYGDRLAMLRRTVEDRSVEQLRYALADAILLSRAPRMYGSTWSSFSELAQRLATTPIKVEMSGVDF